MNKLGNWRPSRPCPPSVRPSAAVAAAAASFHNEQGKGFRKVSTDGLGLEQECWFWVVGWPERFGGTEEEEEEGEPLQFR